MAAVGFGKIILFGEHAVVHGRPAIAMALPRGCVARAEIARGAHAAAQRLEDRLVLYPFGTEVVVARKVARPTRDVAPGGYAALLRGAFATAFADAPSERADLHLEAHVEIPAGAGLGASAAISVAVARAIDAALARPRDPAALIDASLRWERVCHGNPSGIDSAMAVHGGVAEYRRGQPLIQLQVLQSPTLVVAHSGTAPSTKEMVERVAEQYRRDRPATESLFDGIEAIVAQGRRALSAGDVIQLGELMVENHRLLAQLGLSTRTLDDMCVAATEAGALGAKLTGGGGGGCMIALCADRMAAGRVRRALAARDPQAFIVEGTQ